MINLLVSLGAGAAATVLLATFFPWLAAAVPGALITVGVYVLLAKKSLTDLQAISEKAQKELAAQKIDRAIETLHGGFAIAKRQFLIGPMLHGEIGTLHYVKKEFDKAEPHLTKASDRAPLARAMLACLYFNRKDEPKMRVQFERAVKHGAKEGLVWAVYAYALYKLGKVDEALQVLSRASAANPSDEKLKTALLALQNGKKFKVKAWSPQIYQFHLEPIPMEVMNGGRRVQWERR